MGLGVSIQLWERIGAVGVGRFERTQFTALTGFKSQTQSCWPWGRTQHADHAPAIGQRRSRAATRLPGRLCPVNEAKVPVSYKNGVLDLTLPKKADVSQKRIAIQ